MAKEKKKAVEVRDGAMNNGAKRYVAEYLQMVEEFGDGRDLDGAANVCPVRRAPDERAVSFITPESILLAKEAADEGEMHEEPAEEVRAVDVGMSVRVDGLLLCDHLALEEREVWQETDEPCCTMVVHTLTAFARDGVTRIASRLAARLEHESFYKSSEWKVKWVRGRAHRSFAKRRDLARSRRNQRAREDAFRVVEVPMEQWTLREDGAALEQEWMEIEAELSEAAEERDYLEQEASEPDDAIFEFARDEIASA